MSNYVVWIPITNEVDYPGKISSFIGEVDFDMNELQALTASMPQGNLVNSSDDPIADNSIIRGDNTSVGRKTQDSGISINDTDDMFGIKDLYINGALVTSGISLSSSDLEVLDGAIAGTAATGKALIFGPSETIDTIDIGTDGLKINGTPVTADASELNKLEGVTAITADLNLLSGLTSLGDPVDPGDLAAVNNFDTVISSNGNALTMHKNVVLGTSGANTIIFNGATQGDIIPFNTNTSHIGSTTNKYEDLWLNGKADVGSLKVNAGNEITDIVTTIGTTDTKIPTEKAVKDFVSERAWSSFFNYGNGSLGALNWTTNAYDPGEYHATTFNITLGQTITLTGPGPLIIKATTSITIGGTIDLSGMSGYTKVGSGVPGIYGGSGSGGFISLSNYKGGYTFMTSGGTSQGAGLAQSLAIQDLLLSSMPFDSGWDVRDYWQGMAYVGGGCGGSYYTSANGGLGGGLVVLCAPEIIFKTGHISVAGLPLVTPATGAGGGGGGVIILASQPGGIDSTGHTASVAGGVGAYSNGGSGWYREIEI